MSLQELQILNSMCHGVAQECNDVVYGIEGMASNIKQMRDIVSEANKKKKEIEAEKPECFLSARDNFKGSKTKKVTEKEKKKTVALRDAQERMAAEQQVHLDKALEGMEKIRKSVRATILKCTMLFPSEMFRQMVELDVNPCIRIAEKYVETIKFIDETFANIDGVGRVEPLSKDGQISIALKAAKFFISK